MTMIPVVAHHRPTATATETSGAESLAARLLVEQPDLRVSERLQPLLPDRLEDAPTLHLDDLAEIRLLNRFYDVGFLEDRARFRAGDGDFLATCGPPVPGFAEYCERRLGLGSPTWLRPVRRGDPLAVAAACWTDREVRHTLVRALRSSALRFVHPHMGSPAVWTTASLLHHASRRPVKVIAPPPRLTARVNDKLWFADSIRRLFGETFVPVTAEAWNLATLSVLVDHFADHSRCIVVKLPDSAGGAGNVVLDARRFRGRPLAAIRSELKERLGGLSWRGQHRLLVGRWETDVLCAPSAQLWIPPEPEGLPVVEGLYEQILEGAEGYFVGCRPARLPPPLSCEIGNRCWLVGRLFQRLGYVGRCSFDMILTGTSLASCRLEFVECNGRWGGTSAPMTLMNRLFGDWASRAYATRECRVPGLERLTFADLVTAFHGDLYDAATGRGRFILFNPGGMYARPGIDVLALAETWDDACRAAREEFPARLEQLVTRRSARQRPV